MSLPYLVAAAFALDLLLGDPRRMIHPVVLIGILIRRLEGVLEGWRSQLRLAGALLTVLTLLVTGTVAAFGLHLAESINPLLGTLLSLWLAWTTLALRSLHTESHEVVRQLQLGDLEEARGALAMIVGRETSALGEEEIVRACIETVAENTSDGVVAPLFYLCLGGPVLALVYKAASTLDSMVGYRSERYRQFGWASARLDDLLNLVPARLTGLLMVAGAFALRLDGRAAWAMLRRDARKHASPNAGYPEAAAAGALGVQLGGTASYFGRRVEKPTLGEPLRPVSVTSYLQMVRLMYLSSAGALALGLLGLALFRQGLGLYFAY